MLYYVLLFLSVIPPGDVGIVSTFGLTRGRETEAACSGEYLPEPDTNYICLAASSALSSLALTLFHFLDRCVACVRRTSG